MNSLSNFKLSVNFILKISSSFGTLFFKLCINLAFTSLLCKRSKILKILLLDISLIFSTNFPMTLGDNLFSKLFNISIKMLLTSSFEKYFFEVASIRFVILTLLLLIESVNK